MIHDLAQLHWTGQVVALAAIAWVVVAFIRAVS